MFLFPYLACFAVAARQAQLLWVSKESKRPLQHHCLFRLVSSGMYVWCTKRSSTYTSSQYRDGNDGPWSSFLLRVGSPPQSMRVLISTASNQPWVVLPEGCSLCVPSDCPQIRGGIFHLNQSSTWYESSTR